MGLRVRSCSFLSPLWQLNNVQQTPELIMTLSPLSKHKDWRCAVVLYQSKKKKQGSKTIKIARKINDVLFVCLFIPVHTTKKNRAHFCILRRSARAASTRRSTHRFTFFLNTPTHTHSHMRTDKHKIYVHHKAKQHAGGTVSTGDIQRLHNRHGKFWSNKKRPKVTARAARWS